MPTEINFGHGRATDAWSLLHEHNFTGDAVIEVYKTEFDATGQPLSATTFVQWKVGAEALARGDIDLTKCPVHPTIVAKAIAMAASDLASFHMTQNGLHTDGIIVAMLVDKLLGDLNDRAGFSLDSDVRDIIRPEWIHLIAEFLSAAPSTN